MVGRTNALIGALVSSVNGMTGAVILNANIAYDPSIDYEDNTIGDALKQGGGGGAVQSVNGMTGEVVLNANIAYNPEATYDEGTIGDALQDTVTREDLDDIRELPETSSAENGKVLAVVNGEWEAAEIPEGNLPPVTSADNGKVLGVVEGEWAVKDDEGGSLPDVTSADNGKVLGVVNGEWEKTTIPSGNLPPVTSADNGKVLGVVEGEWAVKDDEGGGSLPSVTTDDNGKYLGVVDGEWAKTDPPSIETDVSEPIPFTLVMTESGIQYATGEVGTSTATYGHTDYVDVSSYNSIDYSRVGVKTASGSYGLAFYDENQVFISGIGPAINQSSIKYVDDTVDIPSGAVYARFSVFQNNTSGFHLIGVKTLDFSGIIEKFDEIDSLEQRVTVLEGKVGTKKVSIIGDSISTFALEAGTGGGVKYAGADCTTNYPGNAVRYPYDNVLSVDQTWWKQVLDYFGWELGINESYAGTTITWDGTTETYNRGANKCISSATRVGHLGENGTPDIILVYGGTNDINHNTEDNIQIGTLSTQNIETFEDVTFNPGTYYDAVFALLLRIQHSYPNALVVCLLPYFVTSKSTYDSTPIDVKTHNDAMKDVCEYLGVYYIDLRKTVNIYDRNLLNSSDILHPNAAGMTMIAKTVIHELQKIV